MTFTEENADDPQFGVALAAIDCLKAGDNSGLYLICETFKPAGVLEACLELASLLLDVLPHGEWGAGPQPDLRQLALTVFHERVEFALRRNASVLSLEESRLRECVEAILENEIKTILHTNEEFIPTRPDDFGVNVYQMLGAYTTVAEAALESFNTYSKLMPGVQEHVNQGRSFLHFLLT